MLYGLDPSVERGLVVVGTDVDGLLQQDRAMVHEVVDVVDGRAGHLHPGGKRVTHRVGPWERRQQRRMEVDQSACERVDENRSEDPHEPCRDDQVRPVPGDPITQLAAPGLAICKRLRLEDEVRYPVKRSPVDPGARAVGHHRHDLGGNLSTAAGSDQCLHVRT